MYRAGACFDRHFVIASCRVNSKNVKKEICPYRYTPFYTRISRLNVQFAYKRQNTGAGKSHFLHFLEVARQDALTKWWPNHEPPCLRDCHTFHKVFTVQTSFSGSNTIVTLTETLLCLRGGRETELHTLAAVQLQRRVATPR